jgi:hypothetical protein
MKNVVSKVLILLVIVLSSNAQVKEKKMLLKNEFYAAYGGGSIQEIGSAFEDIFMQILTFTEGDSKLIGPTGPIIIGYKRVFWDHLGLGILASYTSINSEYRKHSDNTLIYSLKNKFITVMGRMDVYYVTNEWVQMYSGGSFGAVNCKGTLNVTSSPPEQDNNETTPAYQINVFSLRVGKNFGGFLELGFGYNGIINGGISYKF